MPIDGLSAVRRLPRLGKLRLGITVEGQKGEYPKAVDHFVLPDDALGAEIAKHYGKEPKCIDVVFPVEDREHIFPQYYKAYKSSVGLWCKGDGKSGQRVQEGGGLCEVPCPCEELEEGRCRRMANLRFMIPAISLAGVFQLDTSSFHTIINVNSGLDAIERMAGRISGVPCTLTVVPIEVSPEGRKQTRWVLELHLATPERFKVLSGQLAKLRDELGHCTLGLPSPQQDKYEETDQIPSSVRKQLPGGTVINGKTGEVISEPAGAVPAGGAAGDAPGPRETERPPVAEQAAGGKTPGNDTEPAAAPAAANDLPAEDFAVPLGEARAKALSAVVKAACTRGKADPLGVRNELYKRYNVKAFKDLTMAQGEEIEKAMRSL